MNKIFKIALVKMEMHSNNFPKGFNLKRDLSIRECKHILRTLLGIRIRTTYDFYDKEDHAEYNEEIRVQVNGWLRGESDDTCIMEFAYDCSDEPLGLFNMLPIIVYLQKIKVI